MFSDIAKLLSVLSLHAQGSIRAGAGRGPDLDWETYQRVIGWTQAMDVLQKLADEHCDGLILKPEGVVPIPSTSSTSTGVVIVTPRSVSGTVRCIHNLVIQSGAKVSHKNTAL